MKRRLFFLLLLVATACGSWSLEEVARHQAMAALRCNAVELEHRGESRFEAKGCGQIAVILCSAGRNEPLCLPLKKAWEKKEQGEKQ
ncbi:MAG: hypothetical protein N2515_03875 [Deltaproteobacteria bacterium]|nr:hypothetical protein [Sandaracinaceae bacterium]MCX7807724.1 hypothetical protein [Deltaproteobacteria bacterium]MDW8247323.1 hypothetical protein [Sandaracinaceae bacterium]